MKNLKILSLGLSMLFASTVFGKTPQLSEFYCQPSMKPGYSVPYVILSAVETQMFTGRSKTILRFVDLVNSSPWGRAVEVKSIEVTSDLTLIKGLSSDKQIYEFKIFKDGTGEMIVVGQPRPTLLNKCRIKIKGN